MKNYPSETSLIFSVPDFSLSYTVYHIFSLIATEWLFCEFLEKNCSVV